MTNGNRIICTSYCIRTNGNREICYATADGIIEISNITSTCTNTDIGIAIRPSTCLGA